MSEPGEPVYTPPADDRIRAHTRESSNQRIDRVAAGAVSETMRSPAAIRARLRELDREWDVDRAVMLNFGVVGALTAWRGMHSRGWRALFWVQLGFLIHHAVRGWCPPLPILRRLGFRSAKEICAERLALENALRDAPVDADAPRTFDLSDVPF